MSTRDQKPDLQADETGQLIERRGWELTDTYLDHGISGRKDKRPELDRMLADARRRRWDVIVVWKADRLFRSLKHMITTLDELRALGVSFVSVTEPFDTETPQGRLLFEIVSAFAAFEAELISERTRASLEAARRRGTHIGRPRAKVDLERARGLRAAGWSLRRVAEELGIGVATLCRALQNAPVAEIRNDATQTLNPPSENQELARAA